MGIKNRSRSIARDRFWERHDKDTYQCPDCGRTVSDVRGTVEVHHKNGNPHDNTLGNLVGLCRFCHNIREGKKPSISEIRSMRDYAVDEESSDSERIEETKIESIYTAGAMTYGDTRTPTTWRRKLTEDDTLSAVEWNSPKEISTCHGAGPLSGVAGADMELLEKSDALVAYFEKEEQHGTLTEAMYAAGKEVPVLVIFNVDVLTHRDRDTPKTSGRFVSEPYDGGTESPYWFVHNVFTGDEGGFFVKSDWEGLENVTVAKTSREDLIPILVGKWLKRHDSLPSTSR